MGKSFVSIEETEAGNNHAPEMWSYGHATNDCVLSRECAKADGGTRRLDRA